MHFYKKKKKEKETISITLRIIEILIKVTFKVEQILANEYYFVLSNFLPTKIEKR